jgi:hypothetical protein
MLRSALQKNYLVSKRRLIWNEMTTGKQANKMISPGEGRCRFLGKIMRRERR